jgi:hypothetical protein
MRLYALPAVPTTPGDTQRIPIFFVVLSYLVSNGRRAARRARACGFFRERSAAVRGVGPG